MENLSGIVQQLKQERDRVQKQLSGLNAAITAFVGSYGAVKPGPKRRKVSAATRRAMSVAQRARRAKQAANSQSTAAKPKRTMSAAARRKIAIAQKARWAARKAKQKNAA